MRITFLCAFLLVFALPATTRISAQETFAPLITENTVLFVHVDLRKADVDVFRQNWVKYSEELLKSQKFDASSLRSSMSALNKDLDKLEGFIRPTLETLTKELGIQEFALIGDLGFFKEFQIPFTFALPWKGKTDDDLETLLSFFPEEWEMENHVFPMKDFLFLSRDLASYEDELGEWLESAKPAKDGAIMQALKSLDNENHDIKIAAAITDPAREILLEAFKNASEELGFPEQVVNMLNFVARKVEWAATSFPNPIFTPAVMEGVWAADVLPIKLTVKTHTATDARMLRNMLNTSIDLAITAWRTMAITMKTEDSVLEPSEFLYEISRGYLRTLLPAVEEDKLVFQLPGYGGRFWDFYMMWYGGFIYQMISSIPSFSGFVPDDETFEIGSEFELYGTTMQDKEFDWDSFRGKYVLVKFTSTWCGPCKMELPGMLAAYEKYHSKGLEIVSVYIWEEDGDKGNNTVKKSVQDEAIPWTIISEPLTEKAGKPLLSETFGNGINGVPTMLIVDKEGKVFATDTRGTKLKLVLKQLFEE